MAETFFVPVDAVEQAQRQLGKIPLREGRIPPEEIGKLLQTTSHYPRGSFLKAFSNFAPIVIATLLHSGELTTEGEPLAQTRDGTIFLSKSKRHLSEKQIGERTTHDNNAIAGAVDVGGLELYAQGDKSRIRPRDVVRKIIHPLKPNYDRFSWCLWQSPEQAFDGSHTKGHSGAVSRTNQWYSKFTVKKFDLQAYATEGGYVLLYQKKPRRKTHAIKR